MSILVNKETKLLVQGITGKEGQFHTRACVEYGTQAVARGQAHPGRVEQPDFDVRGTTLWIAGAVSGGRIAAYHAEFNAERFPWFFDRRFMTRYLDALAAAATTRSSSGPAIRFPTFSNCPNIPSPRT